MSEDLKFIVEKLNEAPFNKNYNLIAFDSVYPEQLLQVLNDVFGEIDEKNRVDIRQESLEDTAVRMLNMLRILKYKPPAEMMSFFRQGLIQGEKQVIYPILEWLLKNMSELKKRTYLAKYLVKIEIADEMRGDIDVDEIYGQYELLIESFKEAHKEHEAIKSSGLSTGELRKDIASMEMERDIVSKRIAKMQRKVENVPNHEAMLEVARFLVLEKERQKELAMQKQDQRNALNHLEQWIARLQKQLKDLQQASIGATPEGLVQRLQEESDVNRYLVNEKLPKEIENHLKHLTLLEKIQNEPAMGRGDIEAIQMKIQAVNSEINSVVEKRMMSSDPIDDKLALFRQQAAMLGRKKENLAEKLNEQKNELATLQEEEKEKRDQLSEYDGETVLRGDEFKSYVNKLRTKSSVYKKQRAELGELRAEYGVLARSLDVLKSRNEGVNKALAAVEVDLGVGGFRDARDELSKVSDEKMTLDHQKGQTLEEMSSLVMQLTQKIADRKAHLAPILKDLRPLRLQCQELQYQYDEKKHVYDSTNSSLESNLTKLEQEVKYLTNDINSNESLYHLLDAQITIIKVHQQTVIDEVKTYVSGTSEEKKNSFREQYLHCISECDKLSRQLKEQQKQVKDSHIGSAKQMKMWMDLERLMECKRKCLADITAPGSQGTMWRESGAETLVL